MNNQTIYGEAVVMRAPFSYATYGPLYYAALGIGLKVAGLAFWPGRLLSVLSTFGSSFILYSLAGRLTKSKLAPLLSVSVFLMSPPVWSYGTVQRVDAVAVFFSVLCFALIFTSTDNKYLLALAGCLAGVAFLLKPTVVSVSLAVVTSLLLYKRFKHLFIFIAGEAVVVLAGMLFILGRNYPDYTFNQQVNAETAFSPSVFISVLRVMIEHQSVLLGVILCLFFVFNKHALPKSFSAFFLLCYLALALLISMMTSFRIGAAVNYYFEFSFVAALCAGTGFSYARTTQPPALVMLLVCVLLGADLMFRLHYSVRNGLLVTMRKTAMHEQVVDDLRNLVPQAEPVASFYPDLVLRAGGLLFFNDMELYLRGPEKITSVFSSYLAERKLGAYITTESTAIDGYTRIDRKTLEPSYPPRGDFVPGPFLYVRDDLLKRD
jgi:4-amino-4-deoxy-L-arabinose transferase-like glycosyltransferase